MEGIDLIVPDTEEKVLAVCLESKGALATALASGLRPEDFSHEVHRHIFKAIRSMNERLAHIDETTLINQLEMTGKLDLIGGKGVVVRIASMDIPTAAASEYISIVKDRSLRRRLLDATETIVGAVHREAEPGQLIQIAERQIFRVSERIGAGASKGTTGSDLAALYRQRSGRADLIPFAWHGMNRKQGGRDRGSLNIYMAYTADGKSIIGLQQALCDARNGYKTAVFSLEMTEAEITDRLLAMMTTATKKQIQHNDLTLEQGLEIEEALAQLTEMDLVLYADEGLTHTEIRSIITREDYDTAIVDYLQRFDYSDYAELPRLARKFKNMALATGCAIDLMSQVTPPSSGYGQNPFPRPTENNAFGGKAISHEGNNVFVLWGHREKQADGVFRRTGTGEMICLKARGGDGEYDLPMRLNYNNVSWVEDHQAINDGIPV